MEQKEWKQIEWSKWYGANGDVSTENIISISEIIRRRYMHYILTPSYQTALKELSGKCMDINCESGYLTRSELLPILNKDMQVIGTDSSESKIEFANRVYSNERLKFEVLDIQTENLPEKYIGQFRLIFAFPSLHIGNVNHQMLHNIWKMLQPYGVLLLVSLTMHKTFEFRILNMMRKRRNLIPYVHKYIPSPFRNCPLSLNELHELFLISGFIHYASENLSDIHRFYKNVNELPLSILYSIPCLNDMPFDRKEDFKDEFMREFTYYRADNRNELVNEILDGIVALIGTAMK